MRGFDASMTWHLKVVGILRMPFTLHYRSRGIIALREKEAID